MTVEELIALLKGYPGEALIVFEDCTSQEDEDAMSYERFEAHANSDGEVVLRLV